MIEIQECKRMKIRNTEMEKMHMTTLKIKMKNNTIRKK